MIDVIEKCQVMPDDLGGTFQPDWVTSRSASGSAIVLAGHGTAAVQPQPPLAAK
ncbi:hypothetical protein [Mycobacterium ostraviense]|uniref:hypothetical protein n=1 Tax=Mycobacterium ostraviense TaxID=2738409 RepID=UPI00137B17CA|nr:hypothetical protein [Mycobacterium ostraviense]UGT93208.1 hypothetical protein LTS72_07890 [Mycobacterium ostraviense]